MKILVVEDEKPLLEAITAKLEIKGYKVIKALTGEGALEKLSEKPDVIWLDLLLPQMQGLEFVKKMKQDPKYNQYQDIPVIVVSNSGSKEKMKEAEELNVAEYLIKAEHSLADIIEKIKKIAN